MRRLLPDKIRATTGDGLRQLAFGLSGDDGGWGALMVFTGRPRRGYLPHSLPKAIRHGLELLAWEQWQQGDDSTDRLISSVGHPATGM